MRTRRTRAWRRSAVVLACCALVLSGCGTLSRASTAPTMRPPEVRRYADRDLAALLLPRGTVPAGLAAGQSFLVPNELVAALLPDSNAARMAMERWGRVQGAAIEFDLQSAPRASEQAYTVISTVAWYATIEGAQSVIADPTMELVLHGFGLKTGEITAPRIGQESRVFRGFRDSDGPDRAAYVALFRRVNLIGAVVVVVPAATDDGGRLALDLARRQASLPMPAGAR